MNSTIKNSMSRKWRTILILSLIGNLFIVYVAYKAITYRSNINHFLDKYTNVVNEFSQRQVYELDNQGLVSDTLIPNRIVFFGTQVTERWDIGSHFPNYEVINRGVPAQRVSGLTLRFRPDVIELAPEAFVLEISSFNFRPESSVKEIMDYVLSMAELAEGYGIAPILTTVIIPWKEQENPENYSVMDSVRVFNRWLIESSSTRDWRCVDYCAVLSDSLDCLRHDLSIDAIDPNDKGYLLMADAVRYVLERNVTSTE